MKKEIDVFIPCCVDQFCPDIGFQLIDLIEKLGYTANYNTNQTCCGRNLYNNGNWTQAKQLGEKFISDFPGHNIIVGCSSSCVGYVKNNCGKLFYNTSNHNSHKFLSERMMDITEFIYAYERDFDFGITFPHKVYLHNSCHSLNGYNLDAETRFLLSSIPELETVNQNNDISCCGFGSHLEMYNKPVSDALAKRKVEHIISLGAEYVVSSDVQCLMKLENYISDNKLPLKTLHIVSLLTGNF